MLQTRTGCCPEENTATNMKNNSENSGSFLSFRTVGVCDKRLNLIVFSQDLDHAELVDKLQASKQEADTLRLELEQ
eukprot:3869489-Amphidinium_carterae.1